MLAPNQMKTLSTTRPSKSLPAFEAFPWQLLFDTWSKFLIHLSQSHFQGHVVLGQNPNILITFTQISVSSKTWRKMFLTRPIFPTFFLTGINYIPSFCSLLIRSHYHVSLHSIFEWHQTSQPEVPSNNPVIIKEEQGDHAGALCRASFEEYP